MYEIKLERRSGTKLFRLLRLICKRKRKWVLSEGKIKEVKRIRCGVVFFSLTKRLLLQRVRGSGILFWSCGKKRKL